MSVILKERDKLLNVLNNIERIIRQEAETHKEFIEELNQIQLAEGQRPDGSFLPPYSQTSVSVYGKPPGAIKLFDTGDFYKGITPLFSDMGLDLIGLDSKTDELMSRYGDVLGLSAEHKLTLSQRMKPGIIKRIKAL